MSAHDHQRSHARRCDGPRRGPGGGRWQRGTEPCVLLRACTQQARLERRTVSMSERAKPRARPVTLSAARIGRGQGTRGRGGPCRIVGPIWYLARSCCSWDRRWPVRSWRLVFSFAVLKTRAPPVPNGFSACSSNSCNKVTDYFTRKKTERGRLFTADSYVLCELYKPLSLQRV